LPARGELDGEIEAGGGGKWPAEDNFNEKRNKAKYQAAARVRMGVPARGVVGPRTAAVRGLSAGDGVAGAVF
jgi:hypothetical protein